MADDDLQALAQRVKRLQARQHRALDERLAAFDTTLVQWDALRAIAREPDASAHRLAELTFQSDQAFGKLAGRLIDRGLVTRRAGHGRALRHALTARGEEVLAAASAQADAQLEELYATLGAEERATLGALLGRLLDEGAA